MDAIRETPTGILIDFLVAPRAARERLGPVLGDRVKVCIHAPPVDGKANEAVIALVAQRLGVRRKAITLLTGEHGRRKTLRVEGATRAALLAILEGEE